MALCMGVHRVVLFPAVLRVVLRLGVQVVHHLGSSAAGWVCVWAEFHVVVGVHVSPWASGSRRGSAGVAFPTAVGRWRTLSTRAWRGVVTSSATDSWHSHLAARGLVAMLAVPSIPNAAGDEGVRVSLLARAAFCSGCCCTRAFRCLQGSQLRLSVGLLLGVLPSRGLDGLPLSGVRLGLHLRLLLGPLLG